MCIARSYARKSGCERTEWRTGWLIDWLFSCTRCGTQSCLPTTQSCPANFVFALTPMRTASQSSRCPWTPGWNGSGSRSVRSSCSLPLLHSFTACKWVWLWYHVLEMIMIDDNWVIYDTSWRHVTVHICTRVCNAHVFTSCSSLPYLFFWSVFNVIHIYLQNKLL